MRYKKILFLSISIGVLSFAHNESMAGMNMTSSLNQALKSNPKIQIDKTLEEEAKAKKERAYSGFLPSIDVELTGAATDEFDRTTVPGTTNYTGGGNFKASITQNLFNGGATVKGIEKAKLEIQQSLARSDEDRILVAFDAADAYIAVRRFQRLYRLSLENIAAHKQYLSRVRQLVKAGKLDTASLDTAKSRLQDAITARDDIYGDVASAVARFIDVVGIRPDRLKNAKIPDEVLPKTLKRAIELTKANNKSILLLRTGVPIAEVDYDLSKASYMPTIDASVDTNLEDHYNGNDRYLRRHNAKLTLKWNLFNGKSDYYNAKAQATKVAKAKIEVEKATRTAIKEVRISWAERLSAQKQAESLRKSVQSKKNIVSAYRKQFDLGRVSLLDLLDAQNEYFLAKGSLITADATQDLTEVRLLTNIGKLIPLLGVDPNGKDYEGTRDKSDATVSIVDKIVEGKI